jgi:hypothetical protein
MSDFMTSVKTNLPTQYRARAQAAREQAASVQDEETRKRLLQEAETWERMAAYEEKNNPRR